MSITVERDHEGYIKNLSAWKPELAENFAAEESLILTRDHWIVLNFLRDFYQNYQTVPPMRLIVKALTPELGTEKCSSAYLQTLFPAGFYRQASRLAGLPKPVRCT